LASDTAEWIRQARTARLGQDTFGALDLLVRAEAAAPGDPVILLDKALTQEACGDLAGALATLDRLLAVDPRHLQGLLLKGRLIDRLHGPGRAAGTYRVLLGLSSAGHPLPDAAVARARQVVAETERRAGGAAPFSLPPAPFLDRSNLPWLEELEAASGMILEEVQAAGTGLEAPIRPGRWSPTWLWRDGRRQEAVCRRFPRTTELLVRLPMAFQSGLAPTAFFSSGEDLSPPPPVEPRDARLRVHLPLIPARPARFRIGEAVRDWRVGQAWATSDGVEREGPADGAGPGLILTFEIWNPLLGAAERDLISEMMLARPDFYSEGGGPV